MSNSAPAGGALALAEEAYALVPVRPRDALVLAERARATAVEDKNGPAEVAALHALGWAQVVLGDARAIPTIRGAIRIGQRHGEQRRVALLRRLLGVTLAFAGEPVAARREIETAIGLLSGQDLAQSQVHRLEIHRRARSADPDVYREVCADASEALRLLRRAGDHIWEARLLFNRGLLREDHGDLDRAEADFRAAHEVYARLGAEDAAVDATAALAEVARRRGEVIVCFRLLDEGQAALPTGHRNYALESVRASALAQARLLPEARAAAESYIEFAARAGFDDEVAMGMLDLAAIATFALDPATARRVALDAARSFAARRKPVAAALARSAWLRARLLEGDLGRSSIRSGLGAATVLELAGWRRDALRTRLLVARIAIALGSHATARRQLDLARPLRASGTVTDRIELLHVRALLRLASGDRAGAARLLERGLVLLEDYRAALGAVELRAAASGIGIELSQAGLRIAVEAGDPVQILTWAERLRGNALRLPLVRPPLDPTLRGLQAELRRAAAQIRDAEEEGRIAPGVAASQARLESSIRARTRLIQGTSGPRTTVPDPHEAAGALGDRALVEYVELDGALCAVTLANGCLDVRELGPEGALAELEWLRFALARLARSGTDPARRAGATRDAQAAAGALDKVLVEPLLEVLGDAPLVLVPTGTLHALPWSALPSLRGRPLVVAPSLSVWLVLDRLPRSRRRKTVLIAGPRLRHSANEVRAIAALRPGATVLDGKAATAAAALAALDGAALAHVACHGHVRSDNPLFSSLELADGPLNVYELQRLRHAPEVVVLSACDLAISGLHPGDELLGLAAALLGMGTRTVVASVVPVPDAAAKRLMLAFHSNLVAGHSAAAALARAQAGRAPASFVCLGSG